MWQDMLNETWLAGLVSSDGCFSARRRYARPPSRCRWTSKRASLIAAPVYQSHAEAGIKCTIKSMLIGGTHWSLSFGLSLWSRLFLYRWSGPSPRNPSLSLICYYTNSCFSAKQTKFNFQYRYDYSYELAPAVSYTVTSTKWSTKKASMNSMI